MRDPSPLREQLSVCPHYRDKTQRNVDLSSATVVCVNIKSKWAVERFTTKETLEGLLIFTRSRNQIIEHVGKKSVENVPSRFCWPELLPRCGIFGIPRMFEYFKINNRGAKHTESKFTDYWGRIAVNVLHESFEEMWISKNKQNIIIIRVWNVK